MTERRLISSFGRRYGRKLKAVRRELLETLLPKVQLSLQDVTIWCDEDAEMFFLRLFPHYSTTPPPHHLSLEIGFGSGEHLAAQAAAHTGWGYIGCEPYMDGVGTLLKAIDAAKLQNIRVFPDDARLLMKHLPEASLDRVFILFPDPWPKARHNKRRLIQEPFLNELARVMKPGAQLRLATDHEDYLTWMLERMLTHKSFTWNAQRQSDWTSPPPDWVRTKYQEWAEKEGRASTYLNFTRT